ncbi:hypothetical protein [Blastococcus sp. TF02A-35]|uniref:hypothetical protein n=1 Tax=Blastococcus sp. TF02A-35 TaxID=2559612 RepID=UPI0010732BFC|nr:hypothetical protein [Blastococcus sp. TF02A_35]TFV49532.1 hypothetical protein E4P43_11835 [Blastococcus sp. TF02A_35]
MEQWEHLLVRVVPLPGGGGRQYVLSPMQSDLQANLHNVGPDHTVALLDELGEDGWELLSVDVASDTYWLKRPAQSDAGFTSL